MSGVLFLFGILIKNIRPDKSFKTILNKCEISFNIRFSEIINIDIVLEDLLTDLEKTEDLVNVGEIEINMGKTYLFTCGFKELVSELRKNPLEISLCIMRKAEGTIFYKWNEQFMNFLRKVEAAEDTRTCQVALTDEFRNTNNNVIGTCDCMIQFSCYGSNIQHNFHIDIEDENDLYINNFNKNTFKCYNFEKLMSAKSEMPLFTISWPSLHGGKDDLFSFKGLDDDDIIPDLPFSEDAQTYAESEYAEAVSLCFRPDEKKYFDLGGLISADVTTSAKGTCVTLTVEKQTKTKSSGVREMKQDYPTESTEDKINKNLCNRNDCPAALKLKEFGFGPLARSKNLGAVYGDVRPSTSYGLSQTYGTFSEYGPYGILIDNQHSSYPKKFSRDIEN